jgi:hypothetical protein
VAEGEGIQAENVLRGRAVLYLAYFNNVNAAPQPPLGLCNSKLKEPLNEKRIAPKELF